MKPTIAIVALLIASPAGAQSCETKDLSGKTIRTDAPCSSNPVAIGCMDNTGHVIECLKLGTGIGTTSIQPDPNWHLLTKSRSGAISLVKGLTEKECETAQAILAQICPNGVICSMGSTDIVLAECFQ